MIRRLIHHIIPNKSSFRRLSTEMTQIILGVLSAGIGLECFLIPNHFIDGGVTGISLLLAATFHWPLSLLIIVINIPFIILGYQSISKLFALKTMVSIVLLAICVSVIDFPIITQDKLLIAVFGGFFLGLGIGLCIRGGSVIDGTEILALNLSRRISMTIGDIILIINIIIFGIGSLVLGLEVSMYSILTYFSASKTLEFIIHGIEEYVGVTVISDKNYVIKKMIIKKLGRGVTIYNGKKGMEEKEIEILYTVVTRLEITRLKDEIAMLDETAFIIEQSINDAKGGMIKKRGLKY